MGAWWQSGSSRLNGVSFLSRHTTRPPLYLERPERDAELAARRGVVEAHARLHTEPLEIGPQDDTKKRFIVISTIIIIFGQITTRLAGGGVSATSGGIGRASHTHEDVTVAYGRSPGADASTRRTRT